MAETNYAEAVAQQDVISELLGKCFAARTVCEQKDISEIPFLRSFIPEGRTSFLILASPLEIVQKGCYPGAPCKRIRYDRRVTIPLLLRRSIGKYIELSFLALRN